MELHIVIDKLGFVREQDGQQTFASVVNDIIGGQYDDADRVLKVTPPSKHWPGSQGVKDVTTKVAWAIFNKCGWGGIGREFVNYNSPAYQMVEHHVGIEQARTCVDRNAEAA